MAGGTRCLLWGIGTCPGEQLSGPRLQSQCLLLFKVFFPNCIWLQTFAFCHVQDDALLKGMLAAWLGSMAQALEERVKVKWFGTCALPWAHLSHAVFLQQSLQIRAVVQDGTVYPMPPTIPGGHLMVVTLLVLPSVHLCLKNSVAGHSFHPSCCSCSPEMLKEI